MTVTAPQENIYVKYNGQNHIMIAFAGAGFIHPWQFGMKPKPYGSNESGFRVIYGLSDNGRLVVNELQTTDQIDRFPHINAVRPYFDFSDQKFLRVKLAKYDLQVAPLPVGFTGRLLIAVPHRNIAGRAVAMQLSTDYPAWELRLLRACCKARRKSRTSS